MEAPREVDCREVSEFLDRYLAGELDVAVRALFELHFAECDACRDYVDSYRATVSAARDAWTESAPVPERLVRAILDSRALAG